MASIQGEGVWRKERSTFCIQGLAEALRSGPCFMFAWPRVMQTPLQSFLQTFQEGTLVMPIIHYLLIIRGSLHFQSLTVTLKTYSLLSNVKATKQQTSV